MRRASILNANGDPARFAAFGLPVVADDIPDFAGPLAGILAGLDWVAAHAPGHRMDGQRAGRLPVPAARSRRAAACSTRCGGHCRSPARTRATGAIRWSGLWPVALRDDLRHALVDEDLRKIEVWTARHGVAIADWPTDPVDPFFNVNTPEETRRAAATRDRRLTDDASSRVSDRSRAGNRPSSPGVDRWSTSSGKFDQARRSR